MLCFVSRLAATLAVAAIVACGRRPEPVTIDLHMMATCPFASHVATELSHAIAPLGDHVELRVSHIGELTHGEALSARGPGDIQADTLQVCADALGSSQQRRQFLACEATQYAALPAGWEPCAKQASLDVAKLRECAEGSRGGELLRASFSRSSAARVSESPTLFIGTKRYMGGRNRYAMAAAICAAFGERKPTSCDQLPRPKAVPVRVVTDARCKDECDLTQFRSLLDHEVPGAQLELVDVNTDKGRALWQASGRRHLPVAIFPRNWQPSGATGRQIAPHLAAMKGSDGLSFAIGTRFDPLTEICDNSTDDDSDGAADCADAQCRYRLHCRQEVPNSLELFILMGDEFSHRGVEAAHHALGEGAFDITVHPIGHTADGGLVATGGKAAVLEGTRLECAQDGGLRGDDLLTYALCRHQRRNDPNWQGCLPATIEREALAACVEGERGISRLTEAYRASEQLAIQQTPFVLVNHRYPLERHDPAAIRAALCEHNPTRVGCKREAAR